MPQRHKEINKLRFMQILIWIFVLMD